MEGSCKCIEKAIANSRKEVVLQAWRLGEMLSTFHHENISLLRNIHRQNLGPELILWYHLS
jgi:hypothetical protein